MSRSIKKGPYVDAKLAKKIEAARMPGYLRPFHFLAMFQYVREKAYETTDYRSYLQGKFNPQIKGGKEVPSW